MIIWILPLVMTALGLVAVAFAARRAAEEAERLRTEVVTVAALRPEMADVVAGAAGLRDSLEALRRT